MNRNLLPPSSLTLFPNWICFPAKRPRFARPMTTLFLGSHFSIDSFARGVKFLSPTFFRTFFIISFPLKAIFLITTQKQKKKIKVLFGYFKTSGVEWNRDLLRRNEVEIASEFNLKKRLRRKPGRVYQCFSGQWWKVKMATAALFFWWSSRLFFKLKIKKIRLYFYFYFFGSKIFVFNWRD